MTLIEIAGALPDHFFRCEIGQGRIVLSKKGPMDLWFRVRACFRILLLWGDYLRL